jgi:hypothetical protein
VEDVQRLNPRVRVVYDTAAVSSKQSAFFEQFDVIVATDLPFSTMVCPPFYPLLTFSYSSTDIPDHITSPFMPHPCTD